VPRIGRIDHFRWIELNRDRSADPSDSARDHGDSRFLILIERFASIARWRQETRLRC
jgi:hypothetical protein